MFKKLEFDKKEDLVRVNGITPQFKPCSIKHFSERGKKVFYYDYWVFDEKKDKLVRRIRRICTGGTKASAIKQATPTTNRIDNLLAKGFHLPDLSAFDRRPVPDAINHYLDHKMKLDASRKDYKCVFYTYLLPYAEQHWEGLTIVDLGKGHIKRFLETMQRKHKWKPQTRNNKKHLISDMFEYYKEMEVIMLNPCRQLKNEKPKSVNHYEVFNGEQLQQLTNRLKHANKQLYVAASMIYYCFIRPEELRHIKIAHISLNEKRITLYGENTKNKQTNRIYIPKRMREILEWSGYLESRKLFYLFGRHDEPGDEQIAYHKLRRKLKTILEDFGLDHTHSLYSFKATGVCNMYRQTKDLMAIKERGRFSSLEIVEIYLSRYNLVVSG